MGTLYWISTSSTDPTVNANWSTGVAPASGDDVYIQAVPGSALANIGASDMHLVLLNSLNISQTYTGTIGTAGTGGYWQIGFAVAGTGTLNIGLPGAGANSGSGRIKINKGANQVTINVYATASNSTDSGQEPVRLLGTNASDVLNVLSGTVGIATNQPGEVSTVLTANVSGTRAVLNYSNGVTWTTANVSGGGSFTSNTAGTTLSVGVGSTATAKGTAKVTTCNIAGTLNHMVRPAAGNASDTINAYSGATIDFTGNPASGTIGTLNLNPGSITVKRNPANPGHITFTTFTQVECGQLVSS